MHQIELSLTEQVQIFISLLKLPLVHHRVKLSKLLFFLFLNNLFTVGQDSSVHIFSMLFKIVPEQALRVDPLLFIELLKKDLLLEDFFSEVI